MRFIAGLFALTLVLIVAASGVALDRVGVDEPTSLAASAVLEVGLSERRVDWTRRLTVAQPPPSNRCASAAGVCLLPTYYPVGTPCSCGGYGGVIVP